MSNKFYRKRKLERLLGLAALLVLIVVSIFGLQRTENDIVPFLHQLITKNQRFEQSTTYTYKVFNSGDNEEAAYISFGESTGYGGPLKIAVLIDTSVSIQKIVIVNHNETPSYVEKVWEQKFYRQFFQKDYHNSFKLDDEVDGISGATYTSEAIAQAAKIACYTIAKEHKGIQLPELKKPLVKFGIPEILLIILYALSLFAIYDKLKWKKVLQWVIMITGLLLIGFCLSQPLSLSKMNSFLIGYWPQWQTNIYWYLLFGGGFIVLISTNKRVYCNWICPFGASQKCLGLIGGAKFSFKGRTKVIIKWIQRALAFSAIATALYFRNPGKMNYEIFGTFFSFTGTSILFFITGVYVLSSMFIKQPYCNTLCPITPVEEFILMFKKWLFPAKVIKANKKALVNVESVSKQ